MLIRIRATATGVSPPKSSAISRISWTRVEFFGSLVKKVDINVAQSLYGQRCGSDGQNECRGKDAAFVADRQTDRRRRGDFGKSDSAAKATDP